MVEVLLQMGALIALGILWQWLRPGGLDLTTTRQAFTSLVYYLFLPALVLLVLWRAPLGSDTLKIAASAAAGVLVSLLAMSLICRYCTGNRAVAGAALLAASFPNATYLGLPVLEAAFGKPARSVAIQYDLFACTPLLLTLGIWLAARYGTGASNRSLLLGLPRVPALWAAAVAVALNVSGVPLPEAVATWLQMLANGVAPLMLIALGISLDFKRERLNLLPLLVPILVVQLFLMPVAVWAAAGALNVQGMTLQAVVLEAAMPSMLLGVVLCDRYGLDTGLYAGAVTLSTALSFLTLPFWFALVGA